MPAKPRRSSVAEVVDILHSIADPALAQEWDNVGLLAGDPRAACRGLLLCIDMTSAVIDDAASRGASLIVACDGGCLTHINGGLRRQRMPQRAIHIAELLDQP